MAVNREELRKLIVGAIATVPTPFDDEFEVDYTRMAEATERWIQGGLVQGKSVIKVAAAMGEGPQLRDNEWPHLLRTAVEAARGRVPVLCGIHYKDTVRTVEDARRAQDLGAIGLQISPPVFNDPTQDDILRYYEAVSDAVEIGVMVYNTHWIKGGAVYPETFRKMADFEHVVCIKWNPPEGVEYEAIYELADTFNIIDNSRQPVRCHRLGGRGFISIGAEVYPPAYVGLWDLMESGRYDEAQATWDRMNPPLRAFYDRAAQNSGGQARVKKAMSKVMGFPVGDSRPPSLPLTDAEIEELREMMVGWGWPVPEKAEAALAR